VYSICLLLFYFILFYLKNSSFASLNSLKFLTNFSFFRLLVIFALLALAGLPPFFTFFLKGFFFIFFLKKGFFFIFFFLVFNLFAMYFYLQNARLLLNNSRLNMFSFYFSTALTVNFIFFLEFLAVFLLFGFFFLPQL
jgi:NADH:ubiquinone oxidoreductase subunit 2 (subunit N)